jgi:hypothetical protein
VIQNGYSFELEKYFSDGWALFRKEPGHFILYTLLIGFISFLIDLIPNEYVSGIAGYLLTPVFTAGFYLGARKIDEGGKIDFSDFFKGFDYIVQLFLANFVSGVLVVIGLVLLLLPGIWFAVGTTLIFPLIIFTGLDFWESIKTSVKIVNKKWFYFFVLLILIGILNLFGLICLVVGLLITFPLTYCIFYAAYKDIVGFSGDRRTDIEDHLVGDDY